MKAKSLKVSLFLSMQKKRLLSFYIYRKASVFFKSKVNDTVRKLFNSS